MKRHMSIFWVSMFLFFLIIGILKSAFKIPEETFWSAYWSIGSIVVAVCVIVDIAWYISFSKKVKALSTILTEELNPDKYIEENEKLLKNKKSKVIIGILKLNIAAGYCDKQEYQKAKEIMLEIPLKGLKGINRVIFDINMAYIHYHMDELAEAQKIMDDNKEFTKFEKMETLGGTVAVLKLFSLIEKGEKQKAQAILCESKAKWLNKRSEDDLAYLEKQIEGM